MEEQRRWSGPPRIPAKLRNSAVETLAKSKAEAAGSYRLRRVTRRNVSNDSLAQQEPPPSPKEEVPTTPATGRGESGDIHPPPPPPPLAASPPGPPTVRRCVSVGEMPTARSMDTPSSCSDSTTTAAVQLGHLQRDKDAGRSGQQRQQERGRSPRGGCRSPGPSLTRRVSAASPTSHGGGEATAIERSVSADRCESSSNKRGDGRRFYEHWSYYNSRPASIVRSATSDMADDILSPAHNDDITAPIPSSATTTTRAAQPTASKGTTGAREIAAVNASESARAAGQAARASRALAVAKERWAKEAKFRLQELRKHSGNR